MICKFKEIWRFLVYFNLVLCVNRSNDDWKHTARLSFIENQIKICESINSPVELELWYSMLGLHLAQHGTERRIRILLDELLGSPMSFLISSKSQLNRKKDTILVRISDNSDIIIKKK